MTIAADLNAKFRAGQPVIGTWMMIPHFMVAETVAQGNFDFILLDGEHAPVHPDLIGGLLPATELRRCPVLYRVRSNNEDLIKAALDAGVAGIWVPFVNSRGEAERVVQAAKYSPTGSRGFGPWRPSNYYTDIGGYLANANASTSVIVQIESAEAVRNIDEITAVRDVDVVFVGPFDLAGSLGLPRGQPHPDLLAAVKKIASAGRRAGKALGIDIGSPDDLATYAALGFSVFTYGIDISYLMDGARAASRTLRDKLASIAAPGKKD
jgi:2-keto-3-deoxy-L-rhamnonate aldolase RhmA